VEVACLTVDHMRSCELCVDSSFAYGFKLVTLWCAPTKVVH